MATVWLEAAVSPVGWPWRPLGDVAQVIAGQSPPSSTYNSDGRGLPFFQGKAEFGRDVPTTVKWCEAPKKIAQTGDILISVRAPVGPTNYAPFDCGIGRGLAAIRVGGAVDTRWLRYWLGFSQSSLVEKAAGTTFEAITGAVLRAHKCPIPPIETQRCIVARIDELFSELDDGEEELRRARADLETYRNSLLKAAVTGELTSDWRAGHTTDKSGADLLARIVAERRNRITARMGAKACREPRQPAAGHLPELPSQWIWASMDQLMTHIEAGLNVKALGRPPEAGETGIVKISAVTWDEFDETESKTLLPSTSFRQENLIRSGDLLISRANTLELVGAPAIVGRINRNLVLSDKVLRLHVDDVVRTWVYYVLKSPLGRRQIEEAATGNQLSMRNISQDSLRALNVPIPPERELGHLLSVVSEGWLGHAEMRSELEETQSSTLRQSILAAAFRGELLT